MSKTAASDAIEMKRDASASCLPGHALSNALIRYVLHVEGTSQHYLPPSPTPDNTDDFLSFIRPRAQEAVRIEYVWVRKCHWIAQNGPVGQD
jgi:hypothetical protein